MYSLVKGHVMRKIILLLVCIVACVTVSAQQYEYRLTARLMYSNNDVECGSHFRILLVTKSGKEITWYQRFNMDDDDWVEFDKTFSTDAKDSVVLVKIHSERFTESLTDCDYRDGGDTEINIGSYYRYPCGGSINRTGIFRGYDGQSSLQVDIKPLSGVHATQINAAVQAMADIDALNIKVVLKYSNNTTEEIANVSARSASNGEIINFNEAIIKSGKYLRVTQALVTTYYRRSFFLVVNQTKTFAINDPDPNADLDVSLSDPFYSMGPESSLRIRYSRPLTPVNYSPGTSNILPSTNDITLSIPETYYGYQWRYMIEGGGWQNLPSVFGTGNKVVISGKKLFDALGADYHNYLFKQITFKAFYTCTPAYGRETAPISLRHLPSAPGIVSTEPIMETCYKDNNARLKITFDRALYAGETYSGITFNELIYIYINGETFQAFPNQLDASHSIEIGNRSPAVYTISLQTTFGVLGNGYSDGDNHKDEEEIKERPPIVNFNAIKADVHCFEGEDGKITVTAQGGTQNYTAYLLQNNNYIDTISLSETAGNNFLNLKEGEYVVRLKDSNGCDPKNLVTSVVIENPATINQPDQKVLLSTVENIEPLGFGLKNGHVTVRAESGTYPYTFDWTDEINNTGMTGDAPVTEGSSMKSTLSNIGKGKYRVVAKDNQYALAFPQTEVNIRGCYDTLTIFVEEPPLLEVALAQQHYVSCYGYTDGEVVAHAKGGRPYLAGHTYEPYQYEWFVVDNVGGTTAFGESDSTALQRPSALYRVKITDRNGIIAWSPDFKLVQPDELKINFTTSRLLCNGDTNGTSQALPQGGTQPYRYAWSTDETTSSISNLTDGMYSVVVVDTRGCTTFGQTEVVVPNSLAAEAVVTPPTCEGYTDGSIVLTVTGGKTDYDYKWQHGPETANVSDIGHGTYTVVVTDANGCFITREYTLDNPELFALDLGPDRVLCRDQVLELNTTIEDPTSQYIWQKDGQSFASTASVTLSDAGKYSVRVTDSKGCFNQDEITITRDDTEIAASLAVATRVPQGGKVRVANISHPAPDRVEWIIPAQATVLEETPEYLELIFQDKGEYPVSIRSFKGLCEKISTSTVRVVDKSELTDYKTPDEPYIKQFAVTPNPNDGHFKATIELREAGAVKLILYANQSNIIREDQVSGKAFIEMEYDVSSVTGSGLYMLQLITAQGQSTYKVMINK
jgi:hypothetical protein